MAAPTIERFITLFQESASLAEVDQWLRNLNYKSLEGKPEAKAQLALVLEILRDELLPNQLTIDRVDSDGLWLKDRNGVQLAWSDMSDGYRAALALLADILRHLINTYGTEGLTARDADGKLFIQRSGVVLIDEIDAHLHPEWQREIGFQPQPADLPSRRSEWFVRAAGARQRLARPRADAGRISGSYFLAARYHLAVGCIRSGEYPLARGSRSTLGLCRSAHQAARRRQADQLRTG
jgi:hypothetical protein